MTTERSVAIAWRIGIRSARANAVPMVALWLLAGATVWAYYAVPSVAAALEPLLRWQTHVPGDCPHKIHMITTPNGKAIRCIMG